MKNKASIAVQDQAMKMAKGNQKVGQSKEQTKLIAQGIEKGIAEYKKQHKSKLREQDKLRKKKLKQQEQVTVVNTNTTFNNTGVSYYLVPWGLLGLSWLGFIGYSFFSQ